MCQEVLFILVVDDDEDDSEFLSEAILKLEPNAHLHSLQNGAEDYLFNLSLNQYPDLIVLDYNMPLLNGLETLEKIFTRTSFQMVPIVIVSTANSPVYRTQCLTSGARKFFVKPIDVDHWQQIAEELIRLV